MRRPIESAPEKIAKESSCRAAAFKMPPTRVDKRGCAFSL